MHGTHGMLKFRVLTAALAVFGAVGVAQANSVVFTDTVDGTKNFTPNANPLGGVAGCTIDNAGAHVYQTRQFTAHFTGAHTLRVTANTNTVGNGLDDPFLAVYVGSFDPANPSASLVGCNDDGGLPPSNQYPVLTANLTNGQVYVLVSTTWGTSSAADTQGTLGYSIDSGAGHADVTTGAPGSGGAAAADAMPIGGLVLLGGALAWMGARRRSAAHARA